MPVGSSLDRRAAPRGALPTETGMLPQDVVVELLELRRRHDAHLIGEQAAVGVERAQGLDRATGTRQRQHQHGAQPLTEWFRRDLEPRARR